MASTRFKELIESGIIWIDEDFNYVGMAADGEEVILGNVGEEDKVERYLQDYPETNQW